MTHRKATCLQDAKVPAAAGKDHPRSTLLHRTLRPRPRRPGSLQRPIWRPHGSGTSSWTPRTKLKGLRPAFLCLPGQRSGFRGFHGGVGNSLLHSARRPPPQQGTNEGDPWQLCGRKRAATVSSTLARCLRRQRSSTSQWRRLPLHAGRVQSPLRPRLFSARGSAPLRSCSRGPREPRSSFMRTQRTPGSRALRWWSRLYRASRASGRSSATNLSRTRSKQ